MFVWPMHACKQGYNYARLWSQSALRNEQRTPCVLQVQYCTATSVGSIAPAKLRSDMHTNSCGRANNDCERQESRAVYYKAPFEHCCRLLPCDDMELALLEEGA